MRSDATVNYHIRSTEPQAFHFDVDGVAGKLLSPDLLPRSVSVKDLRDSASTVCFDVDGISFEKHVTQIQEFAGSPDWDNDYDAELRVLLMKKIGADEVVVFDHTLRIDDPIANRKPARNVHNDYSPSSAHQRLIDILGKEQARDFAAGHYGFVNVWRPVEHPIESAPLGFIRPSSVNAEDWMTIDLVYPHRTGQILGLAPSEDHDWFYLSRMTPDEVAIFNIYDNKGRPFLGHSALDMEGHGSTRAPRKSIESRTLVRYR